VIELLRAIARQLEDCAVSLDRLYGTVNTAQLVKLARGVRAVVEEVAEEAKARA
jgi:hypothetical protein